MMTITNSLIRSKSYIIRGIGYRAQVVDNNWLLNSNSNEIKQIAANEFPQERYLLVRVGYSYILYIPIPNLVGVLVSKKDRKLTIYSQSKALTSIFSQAIFKLRAPSVYTGRGIRLKKFAHRRKVGKKDVRKGRFF